MIVEPGHKIIHINKNNFYNYSNSFTEKMMQSVIII